MRVRVTDKPAPQKTSRRRVVVCASGLTSHARPCEVSRVHTTVSAAQPGPWARQTQDLVTELGVAVERGLDPAQVAQRLREHGPNRLRETRRRSARAIFISQFRSLIVALLLGATALSLALGDWVEAGAIAAAILLSVLTGFLTELRATRSMEALRLLGGASARVRRAGHELLVPAQELVPGDIVLIEGGDRITADLRILDASKLAADESTLTGESLPVAKMSAAMDAETALPDRANMLYKGTIITRGSGLAVVVATGMSTELGRIAALVEEAEDEATPLERRLAALGRRLVWVSLAGAGVAGVAGVATHKDPLLMIHTAIALAVAAIPEGLPIVATMALARGMWRMARRNALIHHLAAVETLGATSIIVADKTGTLTENRMTVTRLALPGSDVVVTRDGFAADEGGGAGPAVVAALEIAVLCNNASLADPGAGTGNAAGDSPVHGTGDPLELALLVAGAKAGLRRPDLLTRCPEAREEAFDSATKMMATWHADPERGGYRVAVKGAPEAVLDCATRVMTATAGGCEPLNPAARAAYLARSEALAAGGLRVLAMADKRVDSAAGEPYTDLVLAGLIAMLDPPRADVAAALAECRRAGIRVIMATGDQPVTACNVARTVGLLGADEAAEPVHGSALGHLSQMTEDERRDMSRAAIFARVLPEQKLDIIALHQARGAVVAMTGDGVNDAPALKKADIGVAMGKRGTDVAREAADMLLTDDAFASIVAAVHQGRVIFQNIRRFVVFLLSCNAAELLVVTVATLLGGALPILPLQILFLNLITDVFPALALGFGEGDPGIMRRPPRDPGEPILARRHWLAIAVYGLMITAVVLGAHALARRVLGYSAGQAVTVSFLTLGFTQLLHVFNMRDPGSHFARNDVARSPWIWGAVILCSLLFAAAVYVPLLAGVLTIAAPGAAGWLVILAMSLVPWVAGQLWLTAAPAKTPALSSRRPPGTTPSSPVTPL
jgi:Ca2+-transporting ATPase